jgi:hypothetical protein
MAKLAICVLFAIAFLLSKGECTDTIFTNITLRQDFLKVNCVAGAGTKVSAHCADEYTIQLMCKAGNQAPRSYLQRCPVNSYCVDWDGPIRDAGCATAGEYVLLKVLKNVELLCKFIQHQVTDTPGGRFVNLATFNAQNGAVAYAGRLIIKDNHNKILADATGVHHLQYTLSTDYRIGDSIDLNICYANPTTAALSIFLTYFLNSQSAA